MSCLRLMSHDFAIPVLCTRLQVLVCTNWKTNSSTRLMSRHEPGNRLCSSLRDIQFVRTTCPHGKSRFRDHDDQHYATRAGHMTSIRTTTNSYVRDTDAVEVVSCDFRRVRAGWPHFWTWLCGSVGLAGRMTIRCEARGNETLS